MVPGPSCPLSFSVIVMGRCWSARANHKLVIRERDTKIICFLLSFRNNTGFYMKRSSWNQTRFMTLPFQEPPLCSLTKIHNCGKAQMKSSPLVTPKTSFIVCLLLSRTTHRGSFFIHIYFVFRKKWPIPRVKWKLVQRISFCRKRGSILLHRPVNLLVIRRIKKKSLSKMSLSSLLVGFLCQLDGFRLSGIASKSSPRWPEWTQRQALPMLASFCPFFFG